MFVFQNWNIFFLLPDITLSTKGFASFVPIPCLELHQERKKDIQLLNLLMHWAAFQKKLCQNGIL